LYKVTSSDVVFHWSSANSDYLRITHQFGLNTKIPLNQSDLWERVHASCHCGLLRDIPRTVLLDIASCLYVSLYSILDINFYVLNRTS